MATWADRNAKARSLGYRNYYDYRIHGYGKIAQSEEIQGVELSMARGHRSRSEMLDMIEEGDNVVVWRTGDRDRLGRYTSVDFLVKKQNGDEELFRLTRGQLTVPELEYLIGEIDLLGGVTSPSPSFDIGVLLEDAADYDDF